MYQYEGREKNLLRRNQDIIQMFNEMPHVCPSTGLRYDINSIYELIAHRFYLSTQQVERILLGKAKPKRQPVQMEIGFGE